MGTLLRRLPRISVLFAPERRDVVTGDPPSIVSSPTSCARVVTSLLATVLEANPSTETNLRMGTSPWSILDLEFSPWLMLDPTPMAPSFSSAQLRLSGWMASTSSSDRLSRVWTLSRRSRALDPKVARPPRKLLSLTVASAKTIGDCLNKYFNYEIPLISSHVATIIVFLTYTMYLTGF